MAFQALPVRLQLYILLHALLFGPVTYLLLNLQGGRNDLALSGLLVLAALVFSTYQVELPMLTGRMTLTFAVVCLALFRQGPGVASACAVLGAILSLCIKRKDNSLRISFKRPVAYQLLFNLANCSTACVVAAAA